MLSISTRRHVGSDDETATTSKIYDAYFPPRESVREIDSHGQTSTRSFQSAGIYQSSKLLFPPFFQLSSPLPFPFAGCALSQSPDLRQTRFFPSLSVSPTLPENMRHTNKTTQAAQRISMLFLSYRRATNERTVSPFFRPLFFPAIVFYPWDRHRRPYPRCKRRN